MSQRDFSENELQSTADLTAANRVLFLEKVRQSNTACQNGDFTTAVQLYTDALQLDPTNHILFSNRSAARLKQGQFLLALQDATKARELCPQWPKAYFRSGVALQCLGRYGEALATFSSGLAQDPNSKQLLSSLVEASIKSPLKYALDPIFQQLKNMNLDQSPFVVISVIGQELLGAGQYHSAVTVLESALRIGSCSLKLRGSVFSALSSAYWALNQLDKAISYMQQDLAVAKSLGDTSGECRAHGNLGSAYFSQGSYKEALTAHRYQLVLAMKCKDTQSASIALTSLGHVYTAIGDYQNALASHKQCVQLVKQMGNLLQEAREIGNVGAVYLAMGEFDLAVDCHTQHLRLAKKLNNQVEIARAYSNLGSSHHYKRNFAQAIQFHENVLRIAQQLGDKATEARAYAGLGHACRCAGDFHQAKRWHEKQLEMALAARDKVGEGRACSNLGIVYQLLGEHDHALKLHQAHLTIARQLNDRGGMGRAFGNIGNAYSAAGYYEQAIKYHKQELIISKEVHDRSAEASTHGNLAVAYQALGSYDMALIHYRAHLSIARELKDTAGESCALVNLANCLSSRQEFAEAIQYYEQYLMLSQELNDLPAESKACHFLGYAHYCIGNFREAVRYYDQDLALAKDLQNKVNIGRAYCNLGLAHLALGNNEISLECQKYFLAIAHMTNNTTGKFRALGNIGDILIKMGDLEEAAKMFHRQLAIARQSRERLLEATACGALGLVHRLMKKFDKALGFHTQELTLRQEIGDLQGECRAHGHLGAVHMAIGNYTHAVKCYQEQLERAQELQDLGQEAQAFGNLGIARLNMGHFEEAIGFLEQQLGTLEQVNSVTQQNDRARALGHLGDCYEQLADYEEAIKCHQNQLSLAIQLQSYRDQERAYRGLGHSHKQLGNLQEALVCLEKRLVVAHELGSLEAKASAYGDLGNIHSALNNYEQAINCLEHQRDIARELNDRIGTSDAISSLGNVFQQMGDYDGALRLHKMDLELCENIGLNNMLARTYGNLASVHEAVKNYSESVRCLEKQLSLTSDRLVKCLSCLALGRVLDRLGQTSQAINFLHQALQISQSLNKLEDEAKIRFCLGSSLLASGDKETAKTQVDTAAQILETVRYEQRSAESRQSLYDLQTSCYHTLQQIYVSLGKDEDALVSAERCRARKTTDYIRSCPTLSGIGTRKALFNCSEYIFETVDKFKTDVIYYSIAGDELYAWYLQPQKRIVRFHMTKITENVLALPAGQNFVKTTKGEENPKASSLLEQYINFVRDSLGVNSTDDVQSISSGAWRSSSSENLIDDFASERSSGFLRMVNRNHLLNSSNYSLSSLFSLGSISSLQGSTRSIGSLQHGGSTRSRRSNILPSWHGPSCLHVLYNVLLAPFEDLLPKCGSSPRIGRRELILVLENELYLVPFAVLRSSDDNGEYLSERCSLLTVPSLQSLRYKSRTKIRDNVENLNTSLVIGGPRIPNSLAETWGWSDSTSTLQEATMVAEMLHVKPYLQQNATKETIISELPAAECIHFASNITWKVPAVVLSPGNMLESQSNSKRYYPNSANDAENEEENNDMTSNNMEIPPLTDFMLSSEDVIAMKLNAKLVVLNSCNAVEPINGSAVANFANSWLLAGVGAVLISLWPVPETASKILLRAFYSALLQGSSVSSALAEAMQTVQHTKHFNNPINWAGFMLIGGNIRLSNKVALIGQALCELMKTPDKCRDALRVCLHLVEKSLQRIHRGQKNAMYTTQKSIDNKAGSVAGWKDLLMAVGFRFEPATSSIPSSVFFPQSDPDERLSQCSASLQALLALSPTTLHALSKLINNNDAAEDIINVIKNIISQFQSKGAAINEGECMDISLTVRLWRINGCHELLASLGFDLMEVGQDQVTLRTGKQANRRNCQFVLQALLALFDTQEAPKSLGIDSSSSTESLNEISESDVKSQHTANRNEDQYQTQRKSSMSNLSTISGNSNYNHFSRPLSLTGRKMAASARSAFISYVRRRGEPDGGQTDSIQPQNQQPPKLPSVSSSFDNSLNNTDSELSDGYTTQQMLAKFTNSSKELCYSGLRGTIRICRPGGGGESDANFTPSPPIQNIDSNVTMALAHQTRIKNLYTNSSDNPMTMTIPPPNQINMGVSSISARRPDSSSSASSATDWEGSGHATVLRRAHMQQQQGVMGLPPLPPPRQIMPMVDSLRPMAPVYNNLMNQSGLVLNKQKTASFLESTSSDSELEKGFDIRNVPVPAQNRNKLKLHQHHQLQHQQQQQKQQLQFQETQSVSVSKLKAHFTFMDRLSVRTGPGNMNINLSKSNIPTRRINPTDTNNTIDIPGNNLYFSPAELQNTTTNLVETIEESTAGTSGIHQPHPHHKPKDVKSSSVAGTLTPSNGTLSSKKTLLRHLSREMTPTISEVYHERNIGLNIGPPLSKLLLSKNYDDNENAPESLQQSDGSSPSSSSQALNKIINNTLAESISEVDLSEEQENSSCTPSTAKLLICGASSGSTENDKCHVCNNSSNILCECNETLSGDGNSSNQTSVVTMKSVSSKKSNTLSFSKPWLSNINAGNIVKPSDLTTADILEHQNKMKSSVNNLMNVVGGNLLSGLGSNSSSTENSHSTVKRACSPFSELLRRDEGDGRSVSDSQCSSTFRTDLSISNVTSSSNNSTTTVTKPTLQSQTIRGNLF